MWLVVGLGNPGPRYADNRHNVGFMALDVFKAQSHAPAVSKKFQGNFCKTQCEDHDVGLLWPLTYMNKSGHAVATAMHFHKVPVQRLIVMHDEIDLPFGTLKLKVGGGTAGHNGLRSIVEQCANADFVRLRIGVGRPVHPGQAVEDHVLSDFSKEEQVSLTTILDRSAEITRVVIKSGPRLAMNMANTRLA